jgi:hypothetical protein
MDHGNSFKCEAQNMQDVMYSKLVSCVLRIENCGNLRFGITGNTKNCLLK